MNILVHVCDKTLWTLDPFCHFFNKYWRGDGSQTVTIAGYSPPKKPLPRNFEFRSIGRMEDYPAQLWSSGFRKFLYNYPHELFILLLEDYWLTRGVDYAGLLDIERYMGTHPNVVRFDLSDDRHHAGEVKDHGYCGHYDLIKSAPKSPYHMSLQCAMWRKSLLLEYLIEGESPWDFELRGSNRLSDTPEIFVLGTKQRPVRYTIALWSNRPDELDLQGMPTEDMRYLWEKGILKVREQ